MKSIRLFFIFFLLIPINFAKGENKISYIDIDYL